MCFNVHVPCLTILLWPCHLPTERLRLLEEERKRLEELEAARVALLGQLLEQENARVEAELQELEPVLGQQRLERARAVQQADERWEWERFLACTYTPHPKYGACMLPMSLLLVIHATHHCSSTQLRTVSCSYTASGGVPRPARLQAEVQLATPFHPWSCAH